MNKSPQSQSARNNLYPCPMHPMSAESRVCVGVRNGACALKKKPARHNGHKEAGSEDFDKHSGHSVNIFKAKFWVSFILSIPVVAYSDIAENLLGYTPRNFRFAISPDGSFLNYFLLRRFYFSLLLPIGNCGRDYLE